MHKQKSQANSKLFEMHLDVKCKVFPSALLRWTNWFHAHQHQRCTFCEAVFQNIQRWKQREVIIWFPVYCFHTYRYYLANSVIACIYLIKNDISSQLRNMFHYRVFIPIQLLSFTTDTVFRYIQLNSMETQAESHQPLRRFGDRCNRCTLSYCFAVALFSERKGEER